MSRCCPKCGELVTNGGMELFSNQIPTGWITTTPDKIYKMDFLYFVHSGNYSVAIMEDATLSQIVTDVVPKCCYEFSLFAKVFGYPFGMTATVTFLTPCCEIVGGTIHAQSFSIIDYAFSNLRILTIPAPCCTTAARIDIYAEPIVVTAKNANIAKSEINHPTNIENEGNSENLLIPPILQFPKYESLQQVNNNYYPALIVDDVSFALQ